MDWPFGEPWLLLAAVALDVVAGDPPNRIHPVAGMGWLIHWLGKAITRRGRWLPFLGGLVMMTVGLGLFIGIGFLVLLFRDWMFWGGLVAEIVLLKMMFSLRGLAKAAWQVRQALALGNLAEARRLLGWHLVSRDTAELNESQLAAAAIESVAENASDGVIAPWLFYLIGGLPAALAYRFVNTADAMLGYRDSEREWLGKVPARIDDLFNLVPARLTAAFMFLGARWVGGRWASATSIWWRDARKTASPNAGHPMAAAAGALGVELEKVGAYKLGEGNRLPDANDIGRAIQLLFVVAVSALTLVAAAGFLRRWT